MQINQVIISGNMVEDPELRTTGQGTPVCNFSIANNQRYATKQGEQKRTTFVHVSTFGVTAENIAKYCKKGSGVVVMGELILDIWNNKDGEKRQRLKIQANNVQFLPKRSSEAVEESNEEAVGEMASAEYEDDPLN